MTKMTLKKNLGMISEFVFFQFACSEKLSLENDHHIKKAIAQYLNFQSLKN